jgi:peptide chain release factor
MPIGKSKQTQLKARMQALGIREEDLEEQFVLSSGPGGQNVQKSHTCVVLRHGPSKIEVKCQEERYREINRYLARKRLCDKYEAQVLKRETEADRAAYKARKQKLRRKRRSKSGGRGPSSGSSEMQIEIDAWLEQDRPDPEPDSE